jgi:hypothetical protein
MKDEACCAMMMREDVHSLYLEVLTGIAKEEVNVNLLHWVFSSYYQS